MAVVYSSFMATVRSSRTATCAWTGPRDMYRSSAVLRNECVFASGTPRSSRTMRHRLPKLFGFRSVPAVDGTITTCSPRWDRFRRSVNVLIANRGSGIVRRPASLLVSLIRRRAYHRSGWLRIGQSAIVSRADIDATLGHEVVQM
jgi:hypothetical protein